MRKFIILTLLFITAKSYSQYTLKLEPDSIRLFINKDLVIKIRFENDGYFIYGGSWLRNPEGQFALASLTVNGIEKGNDLVGQLITFFNNSDQDHILYKAPAHIPLKNPVEIKAFFKNAWLAPTYADRTLICHVEIVGGWKIKPNADTAWLCTNDTLPLKTIAEYEDGNQRDSIISGKGWWVNSFITPERPEWTVNGIPNGNESVGQIIVNDEYHVTFKAPSQKPIKNPVEVTATYKDVNLPGIYDKEKKVISYIWINDCADKTPEKKADDLITIAKKNDEGGKLKIGNGKFEVKMEASLKGGSPAAWGGVSTYTDQGSFTVSLEKEEAAVANIKNNLETVTYSTCPDRVVTNPSTRTGMLHVAGTKRVKVTPANPPTQPYPIVEIWFTQFPIELTRFTFNCPPPPGTRGRSKGKVDLTTGAPPPMMMFMNMPALPTYIKFEAKDEEQVILETPKDVNNAEGLIYYKFSVRKIKEQ